MRRVFWGLLFMLGCEPGAPPPIAHAAPTLRAASAQQQEGPWTNRLFEAESPYLKMHAHDPVDWRPWGDEAFAEARRRNVPVFLSIGYFACHWCHVMHRESFSDPAVAGYLNAHFVPIKVDREERPDVDALYMDALNLINGRGGWPASLWLTPDRLPFFAGTYFPPNAGRGRPGFRDVLETIDEKWRTDPGEASSLATQIHDRLAARVVISAGALPGQSAADQAVNALVQQWSPAFRGWGQRTQFPMTPRLRLLARWAADASPGPGRDAALQVLTETLDAIDQGGMNDHLGGGFHRYTVDRRWQVPHFEKMLYDNGQLIGVYAEASVLTGNARYARVVADCVDWLEREMRHPSGAFISSLGADSEDGEEGAFYVWTPDQIREILSEPAPMIQAYNVTVNGNVDGSRTVLNRRPDVDPDRLLADRQALLMARAAREAPPPDTKLVVAWNGLTISGLAVAGRLLDEPRYLELAAAAADAIVTHKRPDGGLPRVVTADEGGPDGVLADYAFTAEGLLDLYEATGTPRWLQEADALAVEMKRRFDDPDRGGFVDTEASDLPIRGRDLGDGSEPSALGRAALVFARLASYGAPSGDVDAAEAILRTADQTLRRTPSSAASLAEVAARLSGPAIEVVISADDPSDPRAAAMRQRYNRRARLDAVVAPLTPAEASRLADFEGLRGKGPGDRGVRGFVCFDGLCKQPTDDPEAFRKMLDEAPPR
ncbi:MAG: thioredoxin domain-containing protein [Myxococcota bacterium]